MKIFFKNVGFGVIFFVSSVALVIKTEAVENYYDFVMRTALKQTAVDAARGAMLIKIGALCTYSGAAFEALMEVCEDSEKTLSKEFIEPLQAYGFVDATGKVNGEFEAFKALKEIALRVKTESRKVPPQVISNAKALRDFFKILATSFVVKEPGSYQESLLNFKFSFSSYRDLLQLFSESFLEKDYYFKTANKKPFIIDCGSNLGIAVLFFKTCYPNAEILAFEPSRICLPFLKKNISDNNFDSITVIDKAVSNKKGECFFHELPENTLGGHLGGNQKDARTIKVDSVLLSEYIEKPVDFLKIDVEGAETLIFEDLDQSKKIKLIKEMGIECHTKNILDTVLKILNKNDFSYQFKREDLWGDAYIVHAFNQNSEFIS